jgi:hypothetical protein
MRTKLSQKLLTATTVLALIVIPVTASAQKYKADVPKSIVTPDAVETRIGTLKFKDGLPDEETTKKVYDNIDFARGSHPGSCRSRPGISGTPGQIRASRATA